MKILVFSSNLRSTARIDFTKTFFHLFMNFLVECYVLRSSFHSQVQIHVFCSTFLSVVLILVPKKELHLKKFISQNKKSHLLRVFVLGVKGTQEMEGLSRFLISKITEIIQNHMDYNKKVYCLGLNTSYFENIFLLQITT